MEEDGPHVGLHVHPGHLMGEGHDPGGRSRPDAGQGQQPLIGVGQPPLPFCGALVRRALQGQGAAVVAEPLPQLQHIGHGCGGQGVHRGKRREEPLPEAAHASHLGLLEHDLGHEHGVGVIDMAPGQRTVQLVAAGEHPLREGLHRLGPRGPGRLYDLPHCAPFPPAGYSRSSSSPRPAAKSEMTAFSSSAYSAESSG